METPFKIIDHTADIGIAVNGATLQQLFENAAIGLFNLIIDSSTLEDYTEYPISISSTNRESLLIDWLNELIYVYEVEHIVFKRFTITIFSDTHLESLCFGDFLDNKRHLIKREVKAATYHMLSITNDSDGFHATIIFDI
ncbi:MAG TPA: hypothetical protein DCX22_00820 [Dehalococcoidia bacterium]|nr:hypothetical protein [Dehalococcoidia bacterium]